MRFLLLFLCINLPLNASDKTLYDNYYNNFFVGEKKTQNYIGPLNSMHRFSKVKGENIFLDDIFFDEIISLKLQKEAFDLSDFWNNKLIEQSTCPDEELSEHTEYMQYAFRLLAISYLFEAIKYNNQISHELGFDHSECSIKFQDLFGDCNPKTNDMKKFKDRIFAKFHNEIEKIKFNELSKKEIDSWINVFKLSSKDTSDPTFSRLQKWSSSQNKSISDFNLNDVKTGINEFCTADKKTIKNLCNEEDSLYGISESKTAFELLKKSNVYNLINIKGMGEFCLNRFVKLNRNKEFSYENINYIFPKILKSLENDKASYLQGSLFMPGALKEFDMKGLSDFLVALRPPKKKIIKKVVEVKKEIPTVETKVEVKEPEIITSPPEVVEEAPIVKIKEFEKSLELIKSGKKDVVYLDMDNFKKDYEFTSKMFSNLSLKLKRFQTRKALTDMRDYDKLGSSYAPFGIIFIKFLIDTDDHQGLYNIISVMGEKFYLQNDFDGINIPVLAQLKNDDTTKHRWQIVLMKDVPSKK